MELLTVKETARLLRVSPITIRRYIASGRLPAERVGRGIRVRREAIEDFVTPIITTAGTPEIGSHEDLGKIYSPSSPEGSVFVPNNDQLGEPFTMDDSMWNMFGICESDDSTELATVEEESNPDELLGKPFTKDDPLWDIVGIGRSDGPNDVARNKDKYLADAIQFHKFR